MSKQALLEHPDVDVRRLFDLCWCGDYRHQHLNKEHDGKCGLLNMCGCSRFRFFRATDQNDKNLLRAIAEGME